MNIRLQQRLTKDQATRGAMAGNLGFNLLEVMIAMAIFFTCYFSLSELLSTNLRAARSLNVTPIDFTQAVYDLLATNRLEEISESGDFGDMYPGWSWSRNKIGRAHV